MAELEFDDDEEAEEEEDEEVRSGSLCGTDSCAIVPRSFADQSGRLAQDAEGKPEYKIRNSYGEGEKELKVSREHARQGTACLRLQDGCRVPVQLLYSVDDEVAATTGRAEACGCGPLTPLSRSPAGV